MRFGVEEAEGAIQRSLPRPLLVAAEVGGQKSGGYLTVCGVFGAHRSGWDGTSCHCEGAHPHPHPHPLPLMPVPLLTALMVMLCCGLHDGLKCSLF